MWLFTKIGFLSVVAHKDAPRRRVCVRFRSIGDARRFQELARQARSRHHLNVFRGRRPRIIETPDGDYLYRINLERPTWELVAQWLTRDVDYPNFKNAVAQNAPANDDTVIEDRLDAYHYAWGAMIRFQEQAATKEATP